jgi:excisionase family DNA binding protein
MDANGHEQSLTMSVDELAKALRIGRSQAYAAVRKGEVPSIKIGKRYLVPVAALKRMLQIGPMRAD